MFASPIRHTVPPDALLTVSSRIPDSALSAPLLGTERSGHGVRIAADGLVITIGYLVSEASQVWLTTATGQVAPAYVVAIDHDSGLALLRPAQAIGEAHLALGETRQLAVGAPLTVLRGNRLPPLPCRLIARQEFAGRWEYLLEEALFTAPVCEEWGGAALIDGVGRLCGIGSLMLELPRADHQSTHCNMFVPIELVSGDLDELCRHGRHRRPPRPWLGSLIQEHGNRLVVVGTYPDCPAAAAGIEPGDVVISVNGEPVQGLAELLRQVWSLGEAGVVVPLTVARSGAERTCRVRSVDRSSYYDLHTANSWN